MISLMFIFMSALIYYPGLSDFAEKFTVPKDFALSLMSTVCTFSLYARWAKGKYLALPLLFPIVIYVALSLLSLKNALSWHLVFKQISFDLMGFSFFWHVVNSINPKQVRGILWLLLITVSIPAGISFLGFDIRTAWSSIFGNPEYGAGLSAIGLAVSVGLIKYAWPLSILLTTHLVLAEARSAILGLFLGTGIVLWLRGFAKLKPILITTVIIVILALLMVSGPVAHRLRQSGSQWSLTTDPARTHIYSASMQYLQQYPLFGLGRGNFALHSYSFVYNYGGASLAHRLYFSYLHNDYLQLWLEAGPVALGVWFFILWRVVWPIPTSLLGAGLFIGLVAELFRGLFLFPFQLGPDVAYFLIVAGFYFGIKEGKK